MEAFRSEGLQVQSFLSQPCFHKCHGVAAASGLQPRHLDSWLMSAEICREIFIHGAESCDLAIVQGRFASACPDRPQAGGSLETLCSWLDLPTLVVLDVSRIDQQELPDRPDPLDGVLLDRVRDSRHLARVSALVESRWGVPVLGGLEELSPLRSEIDASREGSSPSREWCQCLGSRFLEHSQPNRVLQLALRRELASVPPRLFTLPSAPSRLVIGLAFDEAFNCYFRDALDLLESRGVTFVDFSPLRDERLPAEADIVYLGCGHPERFAADLSRNDCMKLALRDHLRNGGRIYAEGGGLAYLCQQIEVAPGECWRMVGVFPAVARLDQSAQPLTPVEVTLDRTTWLAPRGARLRGYRNSSWRLEPAGTLNGCVAEADHRYELVESSRAVGSRLHLNFAAQPDLLPGFFDPHSTCAEPADPWSFGQ
ncbi:MAG TPA: hypothetical protein VMY42_24000 [Thermoguttaceae bacterium]|nr:hypothetical protein [Thermoguttaceae bacterium]